MRPTRAKDWTVSILMLLFGVAALGLGEFDLRSGTTPRSQLTCVRGQPTHVSFSQVIGRWGQTTDYVDFTVSGQHTQYGSQMPNYLQVANVVRSGQAVTLGFSTKQETVVAVSNPTWVPLYELWLGSKPLVTYEDTVTYKGKKRQSFWIGGGALAAGGLICLVNCYRRRQVYQAPPLRPARRW